MEIPREECAHISLVLANIQKALSAKEAFELKELSSETTHSSCNYQDVGSITMAVLVYSLSKIIERGDYKKIKNWDTFVKKFNSLLGLASKSLSTRRSEKFERYIQQARELFENYSIKIKPYIQEVLRKAAINKAFKIYEHGISLERTARMLGISQWELAEYAGQKDYRETRQYQTINTKTRAKFALEFFSS